MSEIIQLQFDSHDIRTVTHDDGSIWWVLSDVCKVLGLSNAPEVKARLEEGESSTIIISDSGNINDLRVIINEQGLYRVIFRSTKPEAKRFQAWVFGEVLPQIRKTGKYEVPTPQPPQLTAQDKLAEVIDCVTLADNYLASIGMLTQRDKLVSADMVRTAKLRIECEAQISNRPALPAPEHFDIAERVKHLGYKVPRKDERRCYMLVGRAVAQEYRERHHRAPETTPRYVDGAVRQVKWYTLDDAPWIDAVIQVTLAKEGLTRAEKETPN